jgi:hypothetical protein
MGLFQQPANFIERGYLFMAKVNTVLGPIDTGDLGFTLMHEHLL